MTAGAYRPLFQECLCRRPFWMLVACVLVNRTRWEQARPVHRAMVARWRTAEGLRWARQCDVVPMIGPLGLSEARSLSLIHLAERWAVDGLSRRNVTAATVRRLPGCGGYAADSWAIFVEGRTDVAPEDRRLKEYLEHVRGLE